MDDLHARFLPLFRTLARSRVAEAISAAGQRDAAVANKIAREMHDIAGEAGLLGLKDVVPVARTCEEIAKKLHPGSTDADVEQLVAALRELERVIGAIEA